MKTKSPTNSPSTHHQLAIKNPRFFAIDGVMGLRKSKAGKGFTIGTKKLTR